MSFLDRSVSFCCPVPKTVRRRVRPGTWLLAAVVVLGAGLTAWAIDTAAQPSRAALALAAHYPAQTFLGHPAPDLTLPDLRTGEPVCLADSRGRRPVLLLFGSFSCPRLYGKLPEVRRLYDELQDRVDFRFVNVREAHHRNPLLDDFLEANPEAWDCGRVRAGVEFYRMDFTCMIADGSVEKVIDGYPARALVLNRDGTVVFDSRPAFSSAGIGLDEAEGKLRKCLSVNGG